MMKKLITAAVLLSIVSAGVTANWQPRPNWKDSYSVQGRCYCDSNGYDHNLSSKSAMTPIGELNVVTICQDIKAALGNGPIDGRIYYNDIQCGHGPANDAADEVGCPGRVDIGPGGCHVKGPKWDLEAVYGDNTIVRRRTAASHNPGDTQYATDGKAETRWTTRQYQRPGQWFQLDLGERQMIGKVTLDSSKSEGDEPAGYTLSTSVDGTRYQVAATGVGVKNGLTHINFANRSVRFVRITQTWSKSNRWWSIHEIEVAEGDQTDSYDASK